MKRRRNDLVAKLHATGVPTNQLQKILAALKDHEFPEDMERIGSRRSMLQSRDQIWKTYGDEDPIFLTLTSPNDFAWYVGSLPKIMAEHCKNHSEFRAMLAELYERQPCTPDKPWRLVLNFDEFVPGAVLSLDNARKAWGFYASVLDMGSSALQSLGAWMPLCVLRTVICKQVQGGFSNACGNLLRRLRNTLQEGFVLEFDSGPKYIFMEFDCALADGAGLQYFWNSKGASALMPCFQCLNVCNVELDEDTLVDHDHFHCLVDIRCNTASQFMNASTAHRFLQADVMGNLQGRTTHATMASVEKAYGFAYAPNTILWMDDVRDMLKGKPFRYDAMHCIFQHGIVEKETNFLLARLNEQCCIQLSDLHLLFNAHWETAKSRSNMLKHIFREERQKRFAKTEHFVIQAGESVALVPLLLYVMETIPIIGEKMPAELGSWRALDQLCRAVMRGKSGIGTSEQLTHLIQRHGEHFTIAYGSEPNAYVPKFHWTKHLPAQLEQDKMILDTFVGERGNIIWKRAAEPAKFITDWEKTVFNRAIMMQAPFNASLRRDGLKNPTRCIELTGSVSLAVVYMGTDLYKGDVLFFSAASVFVCDGFVCSDDGKLYFLGRRGNLIRKRTSNASYWRPSLDVETFRANFPIRISPAWCYEAEGLLVIDA